MKLWPVNRIKRVARHFLEDPIGYSAFAVNLVFLLIREKKLGVDTHGFSFSADNINSIPYEDSTPYAATSYSRLKKMVNYLNPGKEDVFVDLGCGAGRALFFVGTRQLKKVVGVEIRKELADIIQSNIKNLKVNRTPIEIINADAAAFDVKDGTIFYLANPFGEKTITAVIENIRKSLINNPRKIRIAYYCAVYKDLLDSQDWLVPEGQIAKADIFVWRSKSRG